VVCAVEAAPLEKDGHGMEDTVCLTLTARANTHWLLIEPLFSLKAAAAEAAFILVDRHRISRR